MAMPKCSDPECGKFVQGMSLTTLEVKKSGIKGAGEGLWHTGVESTLI